jgi:probable HAF family extracellular repeat protein
MRGLGGNFSGAVAVNNQGRVVGVTSGAHDPYHQHAFSWTATEGMVDLGTLGGSNSRVFAVNDHGQVVGSASLPGDRDTHAFSWTAEGGMIDLGTLGGSNSWAQAVNNRGEITGSSDTAGGGGQQHPFLMTWTDTTPPLVIPDLKGTLAQNGWYRGDVTVTWQVTDPESAITSSSGCGDTTITTDTRATTVTCTATSSGGTSHDQA